MVTGFLILHLMFMYMQIKKCYAKKSLIFVMSAHKNWPKFQYTAFFMVEIQV